MPISGPRLEVPFDLAGILDRGVASKPNEPALVSEESRWTWQDLADSSESLARHLLGLGLEPGDRVASLMPNRAALVIHYLACMKAGLVATPLNYRYMPVEIDHALRLSGASALVAHAERARDLAAAEMVRSLPRGLIAYGDDVDGAQRYEALIERRAPAEKLPSTDPATPAFVFFTSGTTGKPKGVTHSLETMGWLVASMAESMELTPDDVLLPGSSLAHIAAFTTTLAGLCVGARIDIARTLDGDDLLSLMRTTRPTVMNILPTALIALIRGRGATHEDFASLRLCISGGDKVTAALEKEFTDIVGIEIREGYGMTEAGSRISIGPRNRTSPVRLG